MTAVSDRLDAIHAQLDAATPGPWKVRECTPCTERGRLEVDVWDEAGTQKVTGWCDDDEFHRPDAEFIAAAPENVRYLLDLARKQQAQLDAVRALTDQWNARGESDMAFSKTIPDENISIALLTDGATMVENARHIRNALEAKL
jgi:hypothetical protein